MPNSIRTTSNTQFIKNAQAVIDSFSLVNLENLPMPLQFLVKARYFLSVIHDEILQTSVSSNLDRGKTGFFATHLLNEVEQTPLAFLGYDDDLKELVEPLPQMAKQLYASLYANNELTSSSFKAIAKQTLDIHECLEQVIALALYRQVEGK